MEKFWVRWRPSLGGAVALTGLLVAVWLLSPLASSGDPIPPADESQPEAPDPLAVRGHQVTGGAAPGYVADELCGACHRDLYESYQEVAMAQSFYRPEPAKFIEDFESEGFFHEPSRRHYRMERRDDDRLVMHRHQLDSEGQPINVLEQEVDWILGSGNHSRTYLFGTPSGNLYQMPIAWYSQTQTWDVAPGFDRPDHLGMQRRVRRECMFCHNAYPEVEIGSDVATAPHFFPEELPTGIGCQRCHGPGADHARAAMQETVDFKAVYSTIVNPGDLEPRLRDDVCYQCHLQPTVAIAGQRRFGTHTYAFHPGQALADYIVQMEIDEPGRDSSDRFEINHHPYRLEQSRCFIESAGELSCLNCHDPHRKVPVADRASHYRAACLQCHEVDACGLEAMTADTNLSEGTPPLPDVAVDNCVGCHMQKRRPEDVVRVTMTDHFIRRQPGGPELIAPKPETTPEIEDVQLLYPERGPSGALADVYRAVAALDVTGGRLLAAMNGLEQRLPAAQPAGLEPYFELANGHLQLRRPAAAKHALEQILKVSPDFPMARDILALAESRLGNNQIAISHMFKALEDGSERPETHFNLGAMLLRDHRNEEALKHLTRAVELRPVMDPAWLYLGLAQVELEQFDQAIESFRRAITLDPTGDRAYLELGEVLMHQNRRDEALRYWQHGVQHSKAPAAIAAALAKNKDPN